MRYCGTPLPGRLTGFSLIELFVVIAVIMILTALLLPALQAVRARATLAVCLGHTRGIGQAVTAYICSSGGILPPGKYGHQGGSPVPKVWTDLLHEGGYIDNKKALQCPADDVTNNASRYYDVGPTYPEWWASYALVPIDVSWKKHKAKMAKMSNHRGYEAQQILLGESESNFISATWFGWGSAASFRQAYLEQFPFDRHGGRCSYAILDGHAEVLPVPAADMADAKGFRDVIVAQFDTCTTEGINKVQGTRWTQRHVCFWNTNRVGLGITPVTWADE